MSIQSHTIRSYLLILGYSNYKWVIWVIKYTISSYPSLCVNLCYFDKCFHTMSIVKLHFELHLRCLWEFLKHKHHYNYPSLSSKQPLTIGSCQSFFFWALDLDNHFLSKYLIYPFNISNSYLASQTSCHIFFNRWLKHID
jgi:hypothetical protein